MRAVARTRDWLRYEVPDRYIRRDARGHYKGQKQIWYLLQMLGQDWDLNLRATNHLEFDAWRWNDYWVPLDVVIEFKRGVYEMALTELARVPRHESRKSATCAPTTKGASAIWSKSAKNCAQQLYVPNALPQTAQAVPPAQATQIAQPAPELIVPATALHSPLTKEESK